MTSSNLKIVQIGSKTLFGTLKSPQIPFYTLVMSHRLIFMTLRRLEVMPVVTIFGSKWDFWGRGKSHFGPKMVSTDITSGRRIVMKISRWGIIKVWKGIFRLFRVPKKCFWVNLDYFEVVLSHLKFGQKLGFFLIFGRKRVKMAVYSTFQAQKSAEKCILGPIHQSEK